jgi:hypothetical protein
MRWRCIRWRAPVAPTLNSIAGSPCQAVRSLSHQRCGDVVSLNPRADGHWAESGCPPQIGIDGERRSRLEPSIITSPTTLTTSLPPCSSLTLHHFSLLNLLLALFTRHSLIRFTWPSKSKNTNPQPKHPAARKCTPASNERPSERPRASLRTSPALLTSGPSTWRNQS